MKKMIILFAAMATTATAALAQEVKIGITGGATLSKPAVKGTSMEVKAMPGFYVGGIADFAFNKYLSLQGGLNFGIKGYHLKDVDAGTTYDVKGNPVYLELPVSIVGKLPLGDGKLFASAGSYLGYGFAGKYKTTVSNAVVSTENEEDINWGEDKSKDNLKPLDFGMNIGAGYEFNSGLFFNIGYQAGVANLLPGGNDNNSYKTGMVKLGAGFFF